MLYVLVSTRFQVLFTPLPGFFSPFLHSTYTLSVIREYLGLEGGPPIFPRGFLVSRGTLDTDKPDQYFVYVTITLCGEPSHVLRLYFTILHFCPNPEDIATFSLASSAFARHYLQNLG